MDGVKKLSKAGMAIKIILMVTNALVMVFGLILVGVGAAGLANQFTVLTSITLASGIIVIGVFLLLIAFLGCWGALKENRKLLIAFFSLVLFLVVIQFAVGIAAYVMKDDLPIWADQTWSYLYVNDKSIIDTAENQFQCCGFKTTSDRAVPPKDTDEKCSTSPKWFIGLGTCSDVIGVYLTQEYATNQSQALELASAIQTSEQCCGWTNVADPAPWGMVGPNYTSPCNASWTTPCFTQLNHTWATHYQWRNASGDEYIVAYEKTYKCCGYGAVTTYEVPTFYNDTCVGTKHYTQSCQLVITDAVIASLGAIGGVCIALAILQLFMLGITLYMIRHVPRGGRGGGKDDLDMPPPIEMVDEE